MTSEYPSIALPAEARERKPALPSERRLPFLDGIRGLAILLVMFHHFTVIEPKTPGESYLYNVSYFGPQGVDLFFVLSGFLITGILLDTREKPHFLRNFYIRRTLRIFPLYYLLLAFSFLLLPALFRLTPQFAHKLARFNTVADAWQWYALYCSNYLVAINKSWRHGILDVTWSLSIEEQYYLLWAVAVWFCSRKTLIRVCCAIILISPFIRLLFFSMGMTSIQVYVLTPARLDGIIWGSLLAILARSAPELTARVTKYAWPAAITAAVVTLGPCLLGKWNYFDPTIMVAGYSAVNIMFAGLIWLTYQDQGALRSFFNLRFLRFFGFYSYSIYLFHLPLRAILRDTLFGDAQFRRLPVPPVAGQMIFYVLATLMVIPVSLASWHLMEKRFLSLKRYFQ